MGHSSSISGSTASIGASSALLYGRVPLSVGLVATLGLVVPKLVLMGIVPVIVVHIVAYVVVVVQLLVVTGSVIIVVPLVILSLGVAKVWQA